MAPIRKGDGTVLNPQGVAEVRTGDGRVLWTPDIPDSEALHSRYDFTEEDGSIPVTDQTGNGHDLTNGSYTGVGASINSVQAGEFDGGNDGVYSDTFSSISSYTIIAVVDIEDASSDQNIVQVSQSENVFLGVFNGNIALYAGNGLAGDAANTGVHLTTAVFDGTSSLIRENGTQTASGDAGSRVFDVVGVGSRRPQFSERFFDGLVGEVWTYPEARTSTEIDEAESYLSDKWGIAI